MKNKVLLSRLCICTLAVSLLAGCSSAGSTSETTNNSETESISSETVSENESATTASFASLEKTDLLSGAEERYSGLFTQFYETISIKERKNLKLQRTNLPLKYRKNMTEFCGKKQKN